MLARINSRHLLFTTATLLGLAGFAAHAAAPTTTERVSVSPTGQEGNDEVGPGLAISADGRFVTFTSLANNLWGNGADQAGFQDIFTRDRTSRFTFFDSIAENPLGGALSNFLNDADSTNPALSADGRFVAFSSTGSGLVFAGTPGGTNQVYLRDRRGLTVLASRASGTATLAGDQDSDHAALTADGTTVVYQSQATNLDPTDTNGLQDIYMTKVDVSNNGGFSTPFVTLTTTRINQPPTVGGVTQESNGDSSDPSVSPDGRFVTFTSDASNLVANDNNAQTDVFLKDTISGNIELISQASDGTQGDGTSGNSAVSADGRFVVFTSDATNLVPGDLNGVADVFVRDRSTGTTERISLAPDGTESDGDSGIGDGRPHISADGRFVVFGSSADNLDPSDTNGLNDVFVVDRATASIARVDLSSAGDEGDGDASSPTISADGSTIAFVSTASNLVADKTSAFADAYVVANPFFTGGSGGGVGGNTPPDIVIDAPAEVQEGDTVLLDASGSSDFEGDTLTFLWSQVPQDGVPAVTLTGGNTDTASFTAPPVIDSTDFTFEVAVSDGVNVSTDTVDVIVDPAEGGVVTGRVTDVNGNALVGAIIDVTRTDGATATEVETDGSGSFEVDDVRIGRNTITVTPPDGSNLEPTSATFTISVVNGEPTSAVQNFVLSTPAATLSGVVQHANGQPIPDATVTLSDSTGDVVAVATTDDAGEYRLEGLVRSVITNGLTLTVESPGLPTWSVASPAISASTDNTLDFRYGNLSVTVDGSPKSLRKQLNGTTIDLLVGGTVVASAGATKNKRSVTFRDVPASAVRVRANNPQLTGAVQNLTVHPGPTSTKVTLLLTRRGGFAKPRK